ncbi:uncharacterized protein LOC106653240 isoform X1 [Trichogramma pretiosum]|uniref:uncharacterized protein LOC106653240 isoform X1 n=1 Tax=Trichogramma pretiosum TaxID=7493 RepID=UPI0006C990E0|nr:uncharacterized protein LOC106653240 isoform X1 [Trichogramma pretiosum]
MISPSKLAYQQLNKTPDNIISRKRPHSGAKAKRANLESLESSTPNSIKIHQGPNPLRGTIFYFDLRHHVFQQSLEEKVKALGGAIECFYVDKVSVVVTDKEAKTGPDIKASGYCSGGSGGVQSWKSIGSATPKTPYRSIEGPLSNSYSQKGFTTPKSRSRADAMLERALTQPQQCSIDPLAKAYTLGIPIYAPKAFQKWLNKVENKVKSATSQHKKTCKQQVLKGYYVKIESYKSATRPVFAELQSFPHLSWDNTYFGESPLCHSTRCNCLSTSKNCIFQENSSKPKCEPADKSKEMTRRPRATTVQQTSECENAGFCEICRCDFKSRAKHLNSDKHRNFVTNIKNYAALDKLIDDCTHLDAFLDKSNDATSKDCPFNENRDNSTANGFLPSDEKSQKREHPLVHDYSVSDIKMSQCNGARRNLNSTLDSPHNLRARTKHESGHLLRSKGKPEGEEKNEKSYDKYVIKKRSKGTIWVEIDSDDDLANEKVRSTGCKKSVLQEPCETLTCKNSTKSNNQVEKILNGNIDSEEVLESKQKNSPSCKNIHKENALKETVLEVNTKTNLNGFERRELKQKPSEADHVSEDPLKKIIKKEVIDHVEADEEFVINDNNDVEENPANENYETNFVKSVEQDGRSKTKTYSRKGGKTFRGRQRLSVEERLIEDNRRYYKVEVLGNKLRSSILPSENPLTAVPSAEQTENEQQMKIKDGDKPSSEKPVVVRFKRVRKSELSLLSDEAESFMFGDPRRDESTSEISEDESSILPKDTDSERDPQNESIVLSSPSASHPVTLKQEVMDDDSQDSTTSTYKTRKKRRTQTEAFLKDNTEYYKFETPGSRLSNATSRFQTSSANVSQPVETPVEKVKEAVTTATETQEESVAKIYPSQPSARVEALRFSFEMVPRSEPWYQTYKRQDEGCEYYYSDNSTPKPFLLPYEMENFHEILNKSLQNSMHRKRGRGRGGVVGSRLPRKSPRCHASTLAIMSTIIKKREQTNDEDGKAKAAINNNSAKADKSKSSEKSDVDADLKQIVKSIDDMLNYDDADNDLLEHDLMSFDVKTAEPIVSSEPKGPPVNLIEIFENYPDTVPNGVDGSSCASSDCGEFDQPHKRRKKRKNKTGWPGTNKMKRKLQLKMLSEELQRENQKQQNNQQEISQLRLLLSNEQSKPLDEAMVKNETLEIQGSDLSQREPETEKTQTEAGNMEHKENEKVTTDSRRGKSKSRTTKSKRSSSKNSREKVRDSANESNIKPVLSDISLDKKNGDPLEFATTDDDEMELQVSPAKHRPGVLINMSEDSETYASSNDCSSPKKGSRKRNNTATSDISIKKDCSSSKKTKTKSSSEIYSPKKTRNRIKSEKSSPKTSPKRPKCGLKRQRKNSKRNDSVSSDVNDEFDEQSTRQSISPAELGQKRYQPFVKVTKMSHDQVAVASNRRLRSSSSPKASMEPPRKRAKTGLRRKLAGQWSRRS